MFSDIPKYYVYYLNSEDSRNTKLSSTASQSMTAVGWCQRSEILHDEFLVPVRQKFRCFIYTSYTYVTYVKISNFVNSCFVSEFICSPIRYIIIVIIIVQLINLEVKNTYINNNPWRAFNITRCTRFCKIKADEVNCYIILKLITATEKNGQKVFIVYIWYT